MRFLIHVVKIRQATSFPLNSQDKKLTMQKLHNYALGQWIAGSGKGTELFDAVTDELVAVADSTGLDFAAMMHYGRTVGGPALRKMTFQERGRMLKALAMYLTERKAFYYLSLIHI